jgi:hypothetical protein
LGPSAEEDEEVGGNVNAPGSVGAEDISFEDGDPDMWKWAWDTIQLEVPEEEIHAATESIPSSETTILMTETSTTSQNRSTSVEAVGGLTQSDTMSGSASNDTHSTDDWLCDICGRPFTHRHKLK